MNRRIAYLVGNHQFRHDSSLSTLVGVPNDLLALQRILADPTQGRFETRVFSDASSGDIKVAIEEELGSVGSGDLMLIHYSGHGKLDRMGNLCLATADTRAAALYATSIPMHLDEASTRSSDGLHVTYAI